GEEVRVGNGGCGYEVRRGGVGGVAGNGESLAMLCEVGDRHGEGKILRNLGIFYQSQGRWPEAVAIYEQSLAIKHELGDRHGEGNTLNNLGIVYQSQSSWAKAIAAYQQNLATCSDFG